ncbi:MAG: DUF4123 domain-containing protein [Pseudomonas sp.]
MSGPVSYLLFDGVLRENLLPWLYQQDEPLEITPLYVGTRWAELHDIGPVLVQPSPTGQLLANYERHASLWSCCSLLTSTQPSKVLVGHLQQFIAVTDTLSSHSLLRFADPLVIQYWLDSYGLEALGQILGPIDEWRVAAHQPRWAQTDEAAWLRFSSSASRTIEPARSPNHLGEEQINALDQAHERRLQDRLDRWIEETYPAFRSARLDTWGAWLEKRLHAAREWGLTTERSATVWLDGCIRLGDDAFNTTNSPYSQWLAARPEARASHPDQRIQAFDQAYLSRHQKDLA